MAKYAITDPSEHTTYYNSKDSTESGSFGRGGMTSEMPPEGKPSPAHMGSQSSAPGKEDPIGERGSGYSSY